MKKAGFILKDRDILIIPRDEEKLWDAPWDIIRNDDEKEKIGIVSFEGEKEMGAVPITIEIFENYYRNRGFATLALRMMTEWAFSFKNVFEIKAVTKHENSAAIAALQKAGFVYRTHEHETEYYSIIKQKTSWTGLYLIIGIVAGLIVGFVFSNQWLSLAVAIIVGLVVGSSLDAKENAYRKSITGKK